MAGITKYNTLYRVTNQKPALRTCLMCGKQFHSRGPHNRRCSPCNATLDYKEHYVPAQYSIPNEALKTNRHDFSSYID